MLTYWAEGLMAKIVNLRSAKKAKARIAKKQSGDENAQKYGVSKSEKTLVGARAKKLADHLDGHKLEESCDRKNIP